MSTKSFSNTGPIPDITSRLLNFLETTRQFTPEELEHLQQDRRATRKPLSLLIVEQGLLEQEELLELLERASGYPSLDPLRYFRQHPFPEELRKRVPLELCLAHRFFPIRVVEQKLIVAMEDPGNLQHKSNIHQRLNLTPEPYISPFTSIWDAICTHYPKAAHFELEEWLFEQHHASLEELDAVDETGLLFMDVSEVLRIPLGELLRKPLLSPRSKKKAPSESFSGDELFAVGYSNDPMATVKLVNHIIERAVALKATDIHIEPFADATRLRYRKDSVLSSQHYLAREVHQSVVNRFKIMAKLDVAQHRRPQEGILAFPITTFHSIQLRLSLIPTAYGEALEMRLLDGRQGQVELTALGMDEEQLSTYRENISYSHGLILITGPTGSGKTTTLYATLRMLNNQERKIITIEDPVEYKLYGVTQVQRDPKHGLTYTEALRAFMRQDPDVILLGELRDPESAHTAIDAAMTGHLVFTTLHTNDTSSAAARLLHSFNSDPLLLSEVLLMIVCQRLVRKLCETCKEDYFPEATELLRMGIDPQEQEGISFCRAVGCADCNETGYSGLTGIFEIMNISNRLRTLLFDQAPPYELFEAAQQESMRTLRDSALQKARKGITSLEEIRRRVFYKFNT